jgi:5-methylcytosine-specific restriction endonuclease McrA
MNNLIEKLKAIRAECGYSEFDRAIKTINRERLGTQTEKRKSLTPKQKQALYAKQDGECARCHNYFLYSELTDDHTIPISKGGTNKLWNRRLVCSRCNSSKKDNMPLKESKITGQTILEQINQSYEEMR